MADKKPIKLVFFDMEGTIFRRNVKPKNGSSSPSLWVMLAEHLGKEALEEENVTQDKWFSGGYAGYVEWMEETIKIHQKYGLDKKFFDKVMDMVDYYPGVKETLKELKEKGYRTALISGGFKAQADRAQVDLKIDHAFTACEYMWDKEGNLIHWNLLPCDFEGKRDFMKLIIKEHGLKPEECAFVGDGKNDVPLAKAVGISIAFNGVPELQKACTHSINQPKGEEDFREVLKFF